LELPANVPQGDLPAVAARRVRRHAALFHPGGRRLHQRRAVGQSAEPGDRRRDPVPLPESGGLTDSGGDQLRADGDDHDRRADLRQVSRHRGHRLMRHVKWGTVALYIVTFGGLLYLFVPLVTIAVFTFNDPTTKFNTTWEGFTWDNW